MPGVDCASRYRSGLMFPAPPAANDSFNSATMPANTGAAAEVPPTPINCPPDTMLYGSCPFPASIATSGKSRAPSFGTPGPLCQEGFENTLLTPPPPDDMYPKYAVSFHAISGTYESADSPFAPLVAAQNASAPVPSLNSVPPTAVTSGRFDGKLTANPCAANGDGRSQFAAPESPVATTQVMPIAFAFFASSS